MEPVLRAIAGGEDKRYLLYYAPRTGKTYVQATLAYIFLRLRAEAQISLVVVVNDREALDTQSFDVVNAFIHRLRDQPSTRCSTCTGSDSGFEIWTSTLLEDCALLE